MDLWIRSQDKELLAKITQGVKYYYDNETNEHCLGSSYYELGTYVTKERALEVLDEIHKLVEDLLNYDHLEYKVYSMPKE